MTAFQIHASLIEVAAEAEYDETYGRGHWGKISDARRALLLSRASTALTAILAEADRLGWTLVPKVATEGMIDAAMDAWFGPEWRETLSGRKREGYGEIPARSYAAALAAAPSLVEEPKS